MNSEQLFTCSAKVQKYLRRSAVVTAIQGCVANGAVADSVGECAVAYMDLATDYNAFDLAVVESAGLTQLQSPSFWFDLETGTQAEIKSKLAACSQGIEHGLDYLKRLSSLVEDHADPVDMIDNACEIKLRMMDATDRADDPDRISRLIDGVDLIYRACAQLARLDVETLQVTKIAGKHGRTVVFRGETEAATAARRIIRAANDLATNSIHTQSYSVEEIADSNPFMLALDDLYRVGALSGDEAEDIRQGVLTGSVMVLECGARLYGVNDVGDPLELSSASVAQPVQAYGSVAENVVDSVDQVDELEYLILDLNKKYLS